VGNHPIAEALRDSLDASNRIGTRSIYAVRFLFVCYFPRILLVVYLEVSSSDLNPVTYLIFFVLLIFYMNSRKITWNSPPLYFSIILPDRHDYTDQEGYGDVRGN
jgi:hypothetical protein